MATKIITKDENGNLVFTPYTQRNMIEVILTDTPYDLTGRASAVDFIVGAPNALSEDWGQK